MSLTLMLAAYTDQSKTPDGKYRLTGIETAVLVRLSLYALDDGTHVFPSLNKLVAELKFCRTAIRTAIKSLIDKKRIFLVKEGNSITHMANEYRINLDMLPGRIPVKPMTYIGDVDKYVNNPVDNLCKEPPPMSSGDRVAMSRSNPGAMSSHDTHNHRIQSLNKIIVERTATSDLEKELLMMAVSKRTVTFWIKRYGAATIINVLNRIKQEEKEKGVKLHNLGAYLRRCLDYDKDIH